MTIPLFQQFYQDNTEFPKLHVLMCSLQDVAYENLLCLKMIISSVEYLVSHVKFAKNNWLPGGI